MPRLVAALDADVLAPTGVLAATAVAGEPEEPVTPTTPMPMPTTPITAGPPTTADPPTSTLTTAPDTTALALPVDASPARSVGRAPAAVPLRASPRYVG